MKESELEELLKAIRVSSAIALAVSMNENIAEPKSREKVLRQLTLVEDAVNANARE